MSGRYFFFCASVPNFMITGATMVMPNGITPGAPTRARSRSKMYFCVGRPVGAAVLDRPVGCGPALLVQALLPGNDVVFTELAER